MIKKSPNNSSLNSLSKNLIHPTKNINVVDKARFINPLSYINLFEILSKSEFTSGTYLRSPEEGDKQQFTAIKSIAVWENVWGKFGICQHSGAISSEVLAKVYGKQNAMAAEVQFLMVDVRQVQL